MGKLGGNYKPDHSMKAICEILNFREMSLEDQLKNIHKYWWAVPLLDKLPDELKKAYEEYTKFKEL